MESGLRERVLRELEKDGVLHLREIVSRMEVSISDLKKILDEMVNEGLLEKFSHGGYTFYRITPEGKGYLLKEGSEEKG